MFLNIKLCGAYSNHCAVTVKNQFNIILPFTSRSQNRDRNLNDGLWLHNKSVETNGKNHGLQVTDVKKRGFGYKN